MGIYFVELGFSNREEDDTVSIQVDSDEFGEPPKTKQGLEMALHKTQATAYAQGTLHNLLCQWRSFLHFYKKYKIKQWPTDKHTVCLYAQFLAYSFKSASSVWGY